ncbi:MAG TPA: hypothetical protein VNF26_12855 [Candidatus Baltobacterales bacterium]|nr:hypothetical protein [Candidatus Baltobacterales bacterium]
MREDEFRGRLRIALGEPPQLGSPVLLYPRAARPGFLVHGMALIATTLAILLIVVLVGSRLTLQPRGKVLPASTPSSVTQPAPDSLPCHLAVNLIQEAVNAGQESVTSSSMGFVNIPSGTFQVDPGARVTDLPSGTTSGPNVYSAPLQRWLPATSRALSPDQRSYAYVRLLPAGATLSDATGGELHVVDAATRTDRMLWSKSGDIELVDWSSAGILAASVPLQGGVRLLWRINPATGTTTQAPASDDPMFDTPHPYSGVNNYIYLGTDASGRSVFRLGSRDVGTKYYVVVVDAAHQATTIYSGTAGDPTGLDPSGIFSDAHGLWFGNIDGLAVWLWTPAAGLKRFTVSGGPHAPVGYQFVSSTFLPSGACVPGQFQGVAASPVPPATSPAPPTPLPAVDWSPLLARPLQLPNVAPGAACPVSPQVSLKIRTPPGTKGGIGHGYGQGPVYVSGQITWYSGQQGLMVVTDPAYSGPVLVRIKRLDGTGAAALGGSPGSPVDSLPGGAIGIRQTATPPYWGQWFGSLNPSVPGCYGIQFDGTTVSDYAVIKVQRGMPASG